MAENLEYKSCLQKDSAEHERYAGVPRPISEYGRNGTVHKERLIHLVPMIGARYISLCTSTTETAVYRTVRTVV